MAELPAGGKMLYFLFSGFIKINTLQAQPGLASLIGNRLHVVLQGIVTEGGGWECNGGHTDSIVAWRFGWVCACLDLTSKNQSVPVTKMEKASLVRVEFVFIMSHFASARLWKCWDFDHPPMSVCPSQCF